MLTTPACPANNTNTSRRRIHSGPGGKPDEEATLEEATPDEATLEDGQSRTDTRDGRHSQTHAGKPAKVSLRQRLSHFTWGWFEACMATGALAMLLSQQPNTFPGLNVIGKLLFALTLAQFLVFVGLISFRFYTDPAALTRSLHHPHESFYFGTLWVSLDFILYNTAIYGLPGLGGAASPRAAWLVKALEVCFWLSASSSLLVVIFQYHVIFDTEQLPVQDAMPAWILPAYPFLVLGPLAAKLAASQPVDAAVPMIIGGLLFNGLGWMIAFLMYGLYIARLVAHELPDAPHRPGMFVAVGPAGETETGPTAVLDIYMCIY